AGALARLDDRLPLARAQGPVNQGTAILIEVTAKIARDSLSRWNTTSNHFARFCLRSIPSPHGWHWPSSHGRLSTLSASAFPGSGSGLSRGDPRTRGRRGCSLRYQP